MSVHRAMRGFIGPKDIFRNPEAIFRRFEPTKGDESPFDLVLSHSGEDFAVMGMHFKLGLYEHQSAGALQGVIELVSKNPHLIEDSKSISKVVIRCYQPAFGIIGDPAKRDPHTRQSADHSMVFIVSRLIKKAINVGPAELKGLGNDEVWKKLILVPDDYTHEAIMDADTRAIMATIQFEHGGKEYDDKYPDGIPTSVVITDSKGSSFDSGLVMYPSGHARNTTANLEEILKNKFLTLGALAVKKPEQALKKLTNLREKSAADIRDLYHFDINFAKAPME